MLPPEERGQCLENYFSTQLWRETLNCPRCGGVVPVIGEAFEHGTSSRGICPECGTEFSQLGCYGYESILVVEKINPHVLARGDEVFYPKDGEFLTVKHSWGHIALMMKPIFGRKSKMVLRWVKRETPVKTQIYGYHGRVKFHFRVATPKLEYWR